MKAERIAELLDARPFRPFVIHVSSADEGTFFVDDPKLARLHEDGETLIFTPHRAQSADRWEAWIDLSRVIAVQVKRSSER
jgi:hypothetical protein